MKEVHRLKTNAICIIMLAFMLLAMFGPVIFYNEIEAFFDNFTREFLLSIVKAGFLMVVGSLLVIGGLIFLYIKIKRS